MQVKCQNTLIDTKRVHCIINKQDTIIQMKLSDAKIILRGVLNGEISDSLVNVLSNRDSINNNIISLQTNVIRDLISKSAYKDIEIDNLNVIIKGDNKQVDILYSLIKKQQKEIKKQRILKKLALIGDVVLPIGVAILFLTIK